MRSGSGGSVIGLGLMGVGAVLAVILWPGLVPIDQPSLVDDSVRAFGFWVVDFTLRGFLPTVFFALGIRYA